MYPVAESPRMEINPSEPLGDSLRRAMLEQLAIGRDGFSLPQEDHLLDSKVHLARKAFKRTRAALRLVRDEIGTSAYRQTNVTVRDQSRHLSDLRSARVLVGTLETLATSLEAPHRTEEIGMLRSEFLTRRSELVEGLRSDPAAIAAMLTSLDAVEHQIRQWTLGDDFADLAPSVGRVYRRGRRALDEAADSGTAHAFHDWRKRVNYLRYQIEALSGRLSEASALEDDFNVLSEMLGDEHDLAEFAQVLATDVAAGSDPEFRAELLAGVDRGRTRLQRDALQMGVRLYSDKPSKFVRRLAKSWIS